MAFLRYVTHPQVRISAEISVPQWGLSDVGRHRAEQLVNQPWIGSVGRLLSSGETKALETAAIVSVATGLPVEVRAALHENDRSSTGFVLPDRFEQLADAFFAAPDVSVEGWETAADAQRRVVAATADLLHGSADRDTLIVGHGAAGTLLYSWLAGLPISRDEDQSNVDRAASGGGNYWTYDLTARTMLHRWTPIDLFSA